MGKIRNPATIKDDGTVKCWNGNIEKPLVIEGEIVCSATHPMKPNYDGNSRGRKSHAAKDGSKTICNMLIDEYAPSSDKFYSIISNGKCKICFKS